VDALFFQLVEDSFWVGLESTIEIVDSLTATFQLVTFCVIQTIKMSVAGAALVFLSVLRKVRDVTELMTKLVDVHRVVEMISEFI
jgi:hypothetical protein